MYQLNELCHRGRILSRRRLLSHSVACIQTSFYSSHHNLVTTFFQLHLYVILNLTIYQIKEIRISQTEDKKCLQKLISEKLPLQPLSMKSKKTYNVHNNFLQGVGKIKITQAFKRRFGDFNATNGLSRADDENRLPRGKSVFLSY